MEKREYCVYKHTSPSGKSYIGQTCNYIKRNKRHIKNNDCPNFYNAIQKYGWNTFIHEILFENLTLVEANSLEEWCIREHNTLNPNGYNLTIGGLNHSKKRTPESIQKGLDTKLKNNNGVFPSSGKRTVEFKEQARQRMIGTVQTEQTLIKRSITKTASNTN